MRLRAIWTRATRNWTPVGLAEASALLREFQGIRATHVADRDRLRVELMT